MKILITGARGQLGSELQRVFTNRGNEIIGCGHNELDISRLQDVLGAVQELRPAVVINAAAYNAVDAAETDWRTAFLVNGVGVRNLAIAAQGVGAVLVHYSSDYVFPGTSERPYLITDAPLPIQRYGASKLLGEQYLRDLMDRFFLIRLSWVFGPGGRNNFLHKLMEWAQKRDTLKIVTDQVSCPSYAPDLAEATADLLATGAFGVYHMTNTGAASRYDWARHLLDRMKWEGKVEPATGTEFPTPAQRPAYSVLDGFPLSETIGRDLPDWRNATDRYHAAVTGN